MRIFNTLTQGLLRGHLKRLFSIWFLCKLIFPSRTPGQRRLPWDTIGFYTQNNYDQVFLHINGAQRWICRFTKIVAFHLAQTEIMVFYCINPMIRERDKPAAILLERLQPPQYIQTTDKSSKLPIARLTLMGKCFKYTTLCQKHKQSPWPKMQILNGFTYTINCATYTLKELLSWYAHSCDVVPPWVTATSRALKLQEFITTPIKGELHILHLPRNGWEAWWSCDMLCVRVGV